jgi:hypothetical protein
VSCGFARQLVRRRGCWPGRRRGRSGPRPSRAPGAWITCWPSNRSRAAAHPGPGVCGHPRPPSQVHAAGRAGRLGRSRYSTGAPAVAARARWSSPHVLGDRVAAARVAGDGQCPWPCRWWPRFAGAKAAGRRWRPGRLGVAGSLVAPAVGPATSEAPGRQHAALSARGCISVVAAGGLDAEDGKPPGGAAIRACRHGGWPAIRSGDRG